MALEFGEANFNHLYRTYRARAKRKGLPFYLSKHEFYTLTQQDCFYCGSPPNNINNNKHYNGFYAYNGLDRVENENGYTIDNVVSCCKDCNVAKGTKSVKEFYDWLKRINQRIKKMDIMDKPDYDALTAEYNERIAQGLMPEIEAGERYTSPDDIPPLPNYLVEYLERDIKKAFSDNSPAVNKPLVRNVPLTQTQINTIFEEIHKIIAATREDGQKEYARVNENGFGNFQRIQGFMPSQSQGQILMTYALKHLDGIMSYLDGYVSQRESVKGRIVDLIVYFQLLYAMILADEGWVEGESITRGWKDE